MGLAKAVAVRFPDWGPDFVFLMVSCPCNVSVTCTSSSSHVMLHCALKSVGVTY